MKVVLTKIWRGEAETKFGTKNKIGIKTDTKLGDIGTTDKWISFMYGKDDGGTSKWQEGMEVDIEVDKKGEYVNFKPFGYGIDKGGASPVLAQLVERVEKLEEAVFSKPKAAKAVKKDEPEDDEVDIDFD